MPSPRDVIEDIRRTKYGIGLAPGSPERLGFDALRPVLDAAVQHLSDDLYAEDVHFVLELVQNADDNPYRDGEGAFLRFLHSPGRLLVQNNETGFEEPNVRALCSIGQSSKKKAAGFIGEKGIGFKSVFRVSDEPHVFSNGFRFRFRRRDPETMLGFVVPEWVDEAPDFVDPVLTNILLPLRPDLSDDLFDDEWFEPTLLLFLKRLRTIEYSDTGRGTGWCYRRVDDGDAVELHTGGGVQRWRLARTTAAVPATVREEKRESVQASEVVLAFPLDGEGGADAGEEQEVHAYLPVRGYGLRFVVQADFILSSSREAILADRPWNLWLRDQVAPLFVAAVSSFREAAGALRTTFLRFVPEQPAAGLFGPFTARILASLRETDCILTAAGGWEKPARVIAADEHVQAAISDDDVQQIFGRRYMAPEFQAPPSLLRSLGALVFQTADLLHCLKQQGWLAGKPDGWFANLFAYLSTVDWKQDLDRLKGMRIVPLEDGTLAAVADRRGRVFFPLTKETSYGFEDKLPLVRNSIFDGADEPTRAAASKFLRTLGVKRADPPGLIADYILPLFESDEAGQSWRGMGDGFLIGAVEYIKDHLEAYREAGYDPARLTSGLYIKFSHPENRWYAKPNAVYLGRAYGNTADLESLLDGVTKPQFVDPVYLDRGLERLAKRWKKPLESEQVQRRRTRETKAWTAFFRQIGLVDTLRVVPAPTAVEPGQASCPDLEMLFRSGDVSRIRRAVRLLDDNWSYYRPHLVTDVKRWERGRFIAAGRRPTKLGTLLSDTAWLADTAGTNRRPPDLFVDSPQTRQVLGDDVPYLGAGFRDQRVIDDLEVRKGPTVEAALARLRNLAALPSADVEAVRTLYRFLDQHFESHSPAIVAAFKAQPLCLVSNAPARFLGSGDVFWQNPGPAFLGRRGFLSSLWPGLKQFFVQKVGVQTEPAPSDFAAMLRELAGEEVLSSPQERAVWAIYKEFDRCLGAADEPDDVTGQPWWGELMREQVFWTERDEWWCNEGDLFVNDREEFHHLFRDQPTVAFLKAPTHLQPQISRFLTAAGIPMLSAAVEFGHVGPERSRDHPGLTARCRGIAPYVLRYLFHREHAVYRRLEDDGQLQKLSGLSVQVCDELEVEVSLGGLTARVRQRFSSRLPRIFVAKEAEDDLDGLGGEFTRMLHESDGLGMFVAAVLAKGDAESIERFMRAKGIDELPPAEEDVEGMIVSAGQFDASPGEGGDSVGEDPPGDEAAFADAGDHDLPDEELAVTLPLQQAIRRSGSGDGPVVGAGGTPPDPDPEDLEEPGPTDETPVRAENVRADRNGSARPPGGRSVNPSHHATTPGSPGGQTRDGVPGDGRGDWAPVVPPRQAAVNVQDRTPRPPSNRTPAFGERPSSGASSSEPAGRERDPEPPGETNHHSAAIGRWGEEHALVSLENDLSTRYAHAEAVRSDGSLRFVLAGEVVAEVRWLNWQRDRGVGYDILVREGEAEEYVEVKATADEARASFEVTPAEWECARQSGPRYRILRVYNAGRPDPRIEVLRDPHRLWREGQLTARPVRIEL